MRIVLTNDDGYDAPGLVALWRAARTLPGAEVAVIAPAEAYSGKGHAVSPGVRYWHAEPDGIGPVTVVGGTPADCVRVAVSMPGQPRPDWVLSGVNHGSNLGIDVFYSGTVAAAREAAILGIPAIAVSQLTRPNVPDDWPRTIREATAMIAAIMDPCKSPPDGADPAVHAQAVGALKQWLPLNARAAQTPFWNVNLPRTAQRTAPTGVHIVPVSTDPVIIRYTHRADEEGRQYLEYTGKYHERPATPGTDVATVFDGGIGMSRLTL